MILIAALLALSPVANAAAVPELTRYLDDQLVSMSEAINRCSLETGAVSDAAEEWHLKRFWLRVRPKAAFSVGVLKLEIVPELETLWQR